jgi:hypothetical protein
MIGFMGALKGGLGIASGLIGRGKRKRELEAAQNEYNRRKSDFIRQDTSNLYVNQENVYDDLTVNQEQAQFAAEQQQQALSNTMGGLQGAAGGSGIAALAQSLAGQQSQNLRTASISIGQQEQANQQAQMRQAEALRQQEIGGEYQSRAAEKEKQDTLLGMSQQRLGAAKQAQDAANQAIMGGIGNVVGGVVPNLESIQGQVGDGSFIGNLFS